jgi:hypothetical protein
MRCKRERNVQRNVLIICNNKQKHKNEKLYIISPSSNGTAIVSHCGAAVFDAVFLGALTAGTDAAATADDDDGIDDFAFDFFDLDFDDNSCFACFERERTITAASCDAADGSVAAVTPAVERGACLYTNADKERERRGEENIGE